MTRYAKAIAAALTLTSTWGATALADGQVSAVEWFGALGIPAGVLAVYQVRNSGSSRKRQQVH